MKLGTCTRARCDQPAVWQVTTDGHPNAPGPQSWNYCGAHVFVPTWDESTTPYAVTVKGPFLEGIK